MTTETTQKNKTLIWKFQQQLSTADAMTKLNIVRDYMHPDINWHGPHPINELKGLPAVLEKFWKPLIGNIFMGGPYKGDEWISSTGHYIGTFANDWLGIPATGRILTLRFGEFYRIHNNKIREMYVLIDMLDVMRQVGLWPLSQNIGVEGLWFKPSTYNGLVSKAPDPVESRKTMRLLTGWTDELKQFTPTVINLDQLRVQTYFHPSSIFYGPTAIGACRGVKGIKTHYLEPFMQAFTERKFGRYEARMAEGKYITTSGWRSIKGTHTGEYLGIQPTNTVTNLRVMEWHRRSGDFFKESWTMIDMVDLLLQLGMDVFDKMHDEQARDQWL